MNKTIPTPQEINNLRNIAGASLLGLDEYLKEGDHTITEINFKVGEIIGQICTVVTSMKGEQDNGGKF